MIYRIRIDEDYWFARDKGATTGHEVASRSWAWTTTNRGRAERERDRLAAGYREHYKEQKRDRRHPCPVLLTPSIVSSGRAPAPGLTPVTVNF